jgi:hypothetical protein
VNINCEKEIKRKRVLHLHWFSTWRDNMIEEKNHRTDMETSKSP